MSGKGRLSRTQRRAAIVIGEVLGPHGFALAGGAALHAHGIGGRPTDDLDSFTGSSAELPSSFDLAIEALAGAGFGVEVERRYESFCRLVVSSGRMNRRSFRVDLGLDTIMWETVMTPLGPTLSVRELGANKVLAAFGRNETRDIYDLERIAAAGVPIRQMVADAAAKDAGFDADILSEMVSRTLTRMEREWPADADLPAIRDFCARLVAQARLPTDDSSVDEPRPAPAERTTARSVAPYRRRDGTPVRGYRRRTR